jgi:hypothetical protein
MLRERETLTASHCHPVSLWTSADDIRMNCLRRSVQTGGSGQNGVALPGVARLTLSAVPALRTELGLVRASSKSVFSRDSGAVG